MRRFFNTNNRSKFFSRYQQFNLIFGFSVAQNTPRAKLRNLARPGAFLLSFFLLAGESTRRRALGGAVSITRTARVSPR
jgi:hypothetical protein